jgi:uncharacterized protein
MAESPVRLVQNMFDCLRKHDFARLREDVLAPDIVWRLPGRHPLAGVYHGVNAVLTVFGLPTLTNHRMELKRIDTFGTDGVIELHHSRDETESGVTLDVTNCTLYTTKDGKIVEAQVFVSDQYQEDNFFWAAYKLAPIPTRLGQ